MLLPGYLLLSHAVSTHGIKFVSALEKGCVVATQFHPELSGTTGMTILKVSVVLCCIVLYCIVLYDLFMYYIFKPNHVNHVFCDNRGNNAQLTILL